MLLLAMLVGAPAEVAEVFPELRRATAAGRGAADVLQNLTSFGQSPSQELRARREKIRPIVSDPGFPASADLVKYWLPRVARFSFDVGRAVELTRYAPAAKAVGTSA
jgi:hypothetical protein